MKKNLRYKNKPIKIFDRENKTFIQEVIIFMKK